MPSYRYNSPDSMMRSRQGCQCMTTTREAQMREREAQMMYEREARMRETEEGCCEERKDRLYGMPLAMAYVPWQQWQNLYEAEKGFHSGTIFCELDKPFKGIGGVLR